MKNYTVLGREENTGFYIIREIAGSSEVEVKDEFLKEFEEGFAHVQEMHLTNTDLDKKPDVYDVVKVVVAPIKEDNNGNLAPDNKFLEATGVVKELYSDKHMKDHPYFVEFSSEFEYLNDGLGKLWNAKSLQVL